MWKEDKRRWFVIILSSCRCDFLGISWSKIEAMQIWGELFPAGLKRREVEIEVVAPTQLELMAERRRAEAWPPNTGQLDPLFGRRTPAPRACPSQTPHGNLRQMTPQTADKYHQHQHLAPSVRRGPCHRPRCLPIPQENLYRLYGNRWYTGNLVIRQSLWTHQTISLWFWQSWCRTPATARKEHTEQRATSHWIQVSVIDVCRGRTILKGS